MEWDRMRRQDKTGGVLFRFCLLDDLGWRFGFAIVNEMRRGGDYGSGGLYEREDEIEAGMAIEYKATILVRRELTILTMTVLDLDGRRKCDSRTE
jgi:hypothetical protein